ncbi:MAG TPA: extracellular solute-binding protein [Clostridia bacterium]
MRKRIAILLSLLVCFVSLIGCKFTEKDKVYDPSKTQLIVGNYLGGFGEEWLYKAKEIYEAQNPDVEIVIRSDKKDYEENTLIVSMPTNEEDIYFLSSLSYHIFQSQGYLADITDVVTKKTVDTTVRTKEQREVSILDKIDDEIKDYYNINGKYYGIPFVKSIFAPVYDVDLFEEKLLYFKDGGNGSFITSLSDKKTAGLDGVYGTYDDGLPTTYTEFKKLMTAMVQKGITPFTFSGMNQYYRMRLLASFWVDYEGKEKFQLNNTFSGQYLFEGQSTPTTITVANAYELQKQEGKRYALQFGRDLINNSWYTINSFNTSQSHIEAQQEFLKSRMGGQKPVAMIAEGGWWENEAKPYMNDMAIELNNQKWNYGVRKFAVMPIPKADNGKSNPRKTYMLNGGKSLVCVSQNSDKKDLAKDFLEFTTSYQILDLFTRYTGAVRPYKYEISEETERNLTHYAKNCWDIMNDENVDLVYLDLDWVDVKRNNNTYFGTGWLWNSYVPQPGSSNKIVVAEPLLAFKDNSSLTADAYFAGMYEYHKQNWTFK